VVRRLFGEVILETAGTLMLYYVYRMIIRGKKKI